jgi:hypothetical protein
MKKSRYLRVEESRNRRLWYTQVIGPVIMSATALYIEVPEIRTFVNQKCHNISEAIKNKREERKARKAAQ